MLFRRSHSHACDFCAAEFGKSSKERKNILQLSPYRQRCWQPTALSLGIWARHLRAGILVVLGFCNLLGVRLFAFCGNRTTAYWMEPCYKFRFSQRKSTLASVATLPISSAEGCFICNVMKLKNVRGRIASPGGAGNYLPFCVSSDCSQYLPKEHDYETSEHFVHEGGIVPNFLLAHVCS